MNLLDILLILPAAGFLLTLFLPKGIVPTIAARFGKGE